MKTLNYVVGTFIILILSPSFLYCQPTTIPTQFRLYQNTPEPFDTSGEANIKFDLPDSAFIRLWIEDNNGNLPNSLISSELQPGRYMYSLNKLTFTPGTYICKMEADTQGVMAFRDSIIMHCQVITTVYNSNLQSHPKDLQLYQNYPNPFNPSTNIDYSIPQKCFVTIKVYDINGKYVSTLVNEEKSAGNHIVKYNANNLVSGVYFYVMKAGHYSETQKFVLLK